jgi:predicted transcriptional regulator
MATITIELSGPVAERLRQQVEAERRSEVEIVGDALVAYEPRKSRLPKGAGKYHSGRTDTSQKTEEIIRDAVKEGRWP